MGEITTSVADISWTVELANTKAVYNQFQGGRCCALVSVSLSVIIAYPPERYLNNLFAHEIMHGKGQAIPPLHFLVRLNSLPSRTDQGPQARALQKKLA